MINALLYSVSPGKGCLRSSIRGRVRVTGRRRFTTTECGMGQSASEHSRAADASARAKWKAGERAKRLRIGRRGSEAQRRGEEWKRNPMKNNVLSCLGRRKRESTRAAAAGGDDAGAPTARRDRRAGKLPRGELAPTCAISAASSEAPPAPDTGDIGPTVSQRTAAGPSDAAGLETLAAEVRAAGCGEPGQAREDNAPEPPAMEDQPLGGDCRGPGAGGVTGTAPRSDPSPASSGSDQRASESSVADGRTEAEMTESERGGGGGASPSPDDPRSEQAGGGGGPAAAQTFPGTIPKLIITRDPSPTPSQEPAVLLGARTELTTGSYLDSHGDDESPCSDSGCGGSPALMRSPRKLSNSSSIGLSSASSFEESEDDFTGSDIESSLSPARSLCSPDEGPGVSAFHFTASRVKCCFGSSCFGGAHHAAMQNEWKLMKMSPRGPVSHQSGQSTTAGSGCRVSATGDFSQTHEASSFPQWCLHEGLQVCSFGAGYRCFKSSRLAPLKHNGQ